MNYQVKARQVGTFRRNVRPGMEVDRRRGRFAETCLPAGHHLLACLAAVLLPFVAQADLPQVTLTNIAFEQHLGAAVSPELSFLDESGHAVKFGDYFGRKPVIVVLGYYECPMLCNLVLNGLTEGLQQLKASAGKDFSLVFVSIDPVEQPPLAAAKKRTYLRRYGRAEAADGWHFLTGRQPEIRRMADQVGFRYAYDPETKQFAHPSGIVVLTPQGRIAKYLFGVSFPARDLNAALSEASAERVGSPVRQLLLLCFQSIALTGKYSGQLMAGVRILSVLTLLGLAAFVVRSIRREHALVHRSPAPVSEPKGKGNPP